MSDLQLINLGTVPNDRTGDALRVGGQKINDNTTELFYYAASRHRQCPLVYLQTNDQPSFLSILAGLNVGLQAPFLASVCDGIDAVRGERNLSLFVENDGLGWTLPGSSTSYLWLQIVPITGTISVGYSALEPLRQDDEPSSPSVDQHWFDTINGYMWRWTGAVWEVVYRVFVGSVITGSSSVTSVNHNVINDELLEARREATKAAIIFS